MVMVRHSVVVHWRATHRWRRHSTTTTSLGLQSECKLQEELLRVPVPVRPELALRLLHLPTGHLERDRLVGLSSEQQVLPLAVWRLNLLLVRGHEAMARHNHVRDLWVVDLEEQTLLATARIPLLRHPVAGTTDFHELLRLHARLVRSETLRRLFRFLGGPPGEIRLMLLALRVGQVAALVVVQGQTEFAFVGAEVVLHEVRILVQVDCLQGQLPQPFPAIAVRLGPGGDATAPRLAASTVLEVHFQGPEMRIPIFFSRRNVLF